MISADDYFFFLDEALEGMVGIVTELGDVLANQRPDLPGANSPYAILTHCLGVMEYWGGHIVAGRSIERDRDAEFTATGSVVDLVVRAREARERLVSDTANLEAFDAPRGMPADDVRNTPLGSSQGGALIHIYEELAQHRGQMELTRDILLAPWARRV